MLLNELLQKVEEEENTLLVKYLISEGRMKSAFNKGLDTRLENHGIEGVGTRSARRIWNSTLKSFKDKKNYPEDEDDWNNWQWNNCNKEFIARVEKFASKYR